MSKIIADPTGGVIIGIDEAHYALLESDPAPSDEVNVPKYAAVVPLPNTKAISVSASDSAKTEYYDNMAKITSVSKTEKTISYTKSDFSNKEQRILLGHQVTADGITIEGEESIPPYVAFGFRSLKSNGAHRYVWYLKGRLYMNENKADTREQTITYQNQSINGVFVVRQCDGQMKIQVDSDDKGIAPEVITNWFTVETLNKLRKAIDEDAPAGEVEPEEEY